MTKTIYWIFPVIFILTSVLFFQSLNYFFFQDDWFVLNWVKSESFLSFFKFRTDIIYWRPISMPLFFKFGSLFFGLNHLPYHIVAFIFHFTNTVLVFSLMQNLKISKTNSFFVAFLYSTAAFLFVPLSWLSTTSYIIGPTFVFLTLILLIKNKQIWALTTFILAISSSELALTTIPIAFVLRPKKETLKHLLPIIIISTIYLIVRFLIYPIPSEGDYGLSFNTKVINNLFWYFVWTFNIPEILSTIFYFSNLKGSIIASQEFSTILIFPILFITSSFLIVIMKSDKIHIIKGLSWFIFGISPVIFLTHHAFSMYLVIGSIGIFYIIAKSLDKFKRKTHLTLILAAIWYLSSLLTISFTRQSHWLVNEQAISKAYTSFAKTKVENPPANSTFSFERANLAYSKSHGFTLIETEENIKQSLNDQDAMQVIFNDLTIKSFFPNQKNKRSLINTNVIEIYPSE